MPSSAGANGDDSFSYRNAAADDARWRQRQGQRLGGNGARCAALFRLAYSDQLPDSIGNRARRCDHHNHGPKRDARDWIGQRQSRCPRIVFGERQRRRSCRRRAIRVKPDNSQIVESVIRFDQAQNKFVTTPINLGPETDRLFLVAFGTGIRQRTDPAKIIARIGRADAQVLFAGSQGSLVGVDQVNLAIPRSLAESGEVDVALTMDGQTTNFVKVNIR